MTEASAPLFMQPQWLPFTFVVMWAVITGLLAHISGWAGLSSHFRAAAPPSGERFRFVSGSMGLKSFPVSYGGCLFLDVNTHGFRLSILFPFRFQSPPLFVPWSQVASVTEKKFLFMAFTELRLRDHWPTISIRGKAGKFIQEAYARSSSTGAA